jgi:hypothetical protein
VPSVRKRQGRRILFGCAAVVAASTAVLPWIGGYGTHLFQLVVLDAWAIVAALTSDRYADLHHGPMWMLALLINVFLFVVPAGLFFLAAHRRWPRASAIGVAIWCVFYLRCLFVLFPATDGP